MKYMLTILFPFLFFTKKVVYVNHKEESGVIQYSKNVKLRWSDFKASDNISEAANSSTAITYEYEINDQHIYISVFCTFFKNKSFYKKNNHSSYLLNHEQRHFDITYIYAMELVKRFQSNSCNSEMDAKDIYNKLINEWSLFQDEYDNQTDNSIIIEKQNEWDKNIDYQLNKLK